ncbi:hypothetical protein ACFSQ3_08875 [Sphingobacterium corticis]|uniref:DUF3945 domain-containing protein n=2 Tax=Sphingobacterium corticis TaxID=1812823 RepID=A0ABW5NJE6_9SPHI
MNNFEYLRDQIKYSGFGEHLESDLKKHIEQGKPEFQLKHSTDFGHDKVNAELNFSKSKQTDMYFFNSYQVQIEKPDNQLASSQLFYINKNNNITFKEAYNLMDGRSVHKNLTNKQGESFEAWLQLDFKQTDDQGNFKLKQYHENYGYNLDSELSKHTIKELTNQTYKDNLTESLKKGNVQSATLIRDGVEQKVTLEANPQYKTVNIAEFVSNDMKQQNDRTLVTRQGQKDLVHDKSKSEDVKKTQTKQSRNKKQSM